MPKASKMPQFQEVPSTGERLHNTSISRALKTQAHHRAKKIMNNSVDITSLKLRNNFK